jgi:flagellar protein FlgJ
MPDFLAGSEVAARTDMMAMNSKLQEAQMAATKTKNVKDPAYLASIKKVSQEFESIFLGYMLKQMRKTIPDDPIFGNSNAKDIFMDMHDDSVSKELSKAGGIGLAAMIYKQLASEGVSPHAAIKPDAVVKTNIVPKSNTDIKI